MLVIPKTNENLKQKKKPENRLEKGNDMLLYIGVAAMLALIVGVLSEGGSLFQKILFVSATPVLGVLAYVNKQKMLLSMQTVLTISALLAFFSDIPDQIRYLLLIGIAVLSVGYLFRCEYYGKDPWGLIGSAGLLLIAAGYVTNATLYPLLFNSLLGFGGLLFAIYSGIEFWHYKIRIASLWFILNVIFAIKPLWIVIQLMIL